MSNTSGQQGLFAGETDDETMAASKPKKAATTRSKKGQAINAETMAKRQREISVSEFFTKNRHLLGFDSPRKALLTAVKEAVDNSLDACEEARILPDLKVTIERIGDNEKQFRMIVEDNGPGIVKAQVPHVFGRLLYGSKFHRLRQSRGQQGIGISAAGMYGQLTTGQPIKVRSKAGRRAIPMQYTIRIDTAKNRPEAKDEPIEWDKKHGTEVSIPMEGEYRRGQRSIQEFLKLMAVSNPHVNLTFTEPDGTVTEYVRNTKDLPKEVEEIKPHPHGVELGILLKMIQESENRTVSAFLQQDFSRVGPGVAKEICEKAGVKPTTNPRRLDTKTVQKIKDAIEETKIKAPPLTCIAPIGEDLIIAGLKKEVEADFYQAASRKPVVYRGRPFAVEVGIAYGRPGDTLEMTESGKIQQKSVKKNEELLMGNADEPVRLIRFANRVPLVFQQSACAITKAVVGTNWKNYGLQQPRGALPIGPMVIFVHIASVWVPFTSESKEAIAGYDEIMEELKRALMECGRKLGTHVRKGKKLANEFKKRNYITMYIPHVVDALKDILELEDKEVEQATGKLTDVLERSRKL
ncbi:MAG: DNA topoisomerase VI subunit B [Planctomycetota bacterium]|nr:DNA topoisomerase VI subunit B [Planctomycetota bacterium]MEC9046512.1 DNA topoisomerase VI subunit B [Planctomycetota bacterium]